MFMFQKLLEHNPLLRKIYFFLWFICLQEHTLSVCGCPMKARKGHWNPYNGSDKQLWATWHVPGTGIRKHSKLSHLYGLSISSLCSTSKHFLKRIPMWTMFKSDVSRNHHIYIEDQPNSIFFSVNPFSCTDTNTHMHAWPGAQCSHAK